MPVELPDIDPYKNPEIVKLFIGSLEKDNRVKLTDEEKNSLLTNPAFAERFFNGGLKDSIINGKSSVMELSKLSQDAVTSLTYGLTRNALNEGVIKASQVGELNKDQLSEFTNLIQRGNFSNTAEGDKNLNRVAELLGLDKEHAAALRKSFDKSENDYQKSIPRDYIIPPPPSPRINPYKNRHEFQL